MAKQNLVTINEKKRLQMIATFKRVQESLLTNLNRDTWRVAIAAHKIKSDKEFSLVFKNDKDFASAVGYSAGAFSKLATVGKMNAFLQLHDCGFTTGQAQELIPLFNLNSVEDFENYQTAITTDAALTCVPEIVVFISDYKDTITQKTTKEIRQMVNSRICTLSGEIQDNDVESDTQENDDTGVQDDVKDIDIVNVDAVIMSSAEIVDEIVKIVKSKKGTDTDKYSLILALLSKEGVI